MKKLLLVAFTALVMLGACKKSNDSSDEDNSGKDVSNGCLLTEVENTYDSGGYKEVYTYDSQDRMSAATLTYTGGSFTSIYTYTYTYASDKIVVKEAQDGSGYVKTITYLLDDKGRIVSGNDDNKTSYTYTYNTDGYLASVSETWFDMYKWQTYVDKYTWANGNIVKKESSSTSSTIPKVTTYQYKTDIKPSSFPSIPVLTSYALLKYFGKQTKNLIESEGTSTVYLYEKDNKGNITSMRTISGSSTITDKFKYSCK